MTSHIITPCFPHSEIEIAEQLWTLGSTQSRPYFATGTETTGKRCWKPSSKKCSRARYAGAKPSGGDCSRAPSGQPAGGLICWPVGCSDAAVAPQICRQLRSSACPTSAPSVWFGLMAPAGTPRPESTGGDFNAVLVAAASLSTTGRRRGDRAARRLARLCRLYRARDHQVAHGCRGPIGKINNAAPHARRASTYPWVELIFALRLDERQLRDLSCAPLCKALPRYTDLGGGRGTYTAARGLEELSETAG